MSYILGKESKKILNEVHLDLSETIRLAIEMSSVDFKVLEGMRTLDKQRKLVASGASETLNSRHLTGHAVDLGALIGIQVRWDWPLYYKIAEAVQAASKKLGKKITWGGVWDKTMDEYDDPSEEVVRYVNRCKLQRKKAFLDGPHFQLPWKEYP